MDHFKTSIDDKMKHGIIATRHTKIQNKRVVIGARLGLSDYCVK